MKEQADKATKERDEKDQQLAALRTQAEAAAGNFISNLFLMCWFVNV